MAHKHQKHFAAADDPEYQKPLQTQLHCEYYKRGVYTQYCTFADVIKVSEFFQAYAAHDLRWCSLCNDNHPPTLICFSESCMKPQNQEGVLDSTLNFKWTMDGLQDRVFQLCRYFIINEDHLLPLYLDSLTPDCARFYDSYQYLSLMYTMVEAKYDVLASFLLTYFNKHSYSLFSIHVTSTDINRVTFRVTFSGNV